MRKIIFIIVALCSVNLCVNAVYGQKNQPELTRVACVGDSITAGFGIRNPKDSYPEKLGVLLGKKWKVKNFGVAGATLLKHSSHPFWRTKAFTQAEAFKPHVVVIMLGTNDTKPNFWKRKAEFVDDYIAMIKRFQKLETKPEIWICYPVPAYKNGWEIDGTVMEKEILPMIKTIAAKTGVKTINLYKALSNKSKLFKDGVHPNAKGAATIARTVYAKIKK